jgi:DNA polymerase elongation subunit (family B)
MFNQDIITRSLFLDIETAPIAPDYQTLPQSFQKCWEKKMRAKIEAGELPERLYQQLAGIPAEFAKIICLSCGVVRFEESDKGERIPKAHIRSFIDENEKDILQSFFKVLEKHFQLDKNSQQKFICGHNIREFDIPFICRRTVILQLLPLPEPLQLFGKKPWEVKHLLDTMEFWKFGDNKAFTSLELLAHALGIPSPKSDLDGSQIAQVYWRERDLERIKNYCEQDVKTTMQLALRLAGLELID